MRHARPRPPAPHRRTPLTRPARGLVLLLAAALAGALGAAPAAAATTTVSGRVTFAGGEAVSTEGMTVYALVPGTRSLVRSAPVDAEGRYSLETPVPVVVRAVPARGSVWAPEYYGGSHRFPTAQTVSQSGDAYDIELDRGGSISGRLRVPDGDRPDAWQVSVTLDGRATDIADSPIAPFPVRADGTYTAPGLVPGAYRLLFLSDSGSIAWQGTGPAGPVSTVDVALGQETTGIDAGARWTARLYADDVWAVTGSPAPLRVTVEAPNAGVPVTGEIEARIDDEVVARAAATRGTVELPLPDLPVGEHVVWLRYGGDVSFDDTQAASIVHVTEATTPITVTRLTLRDAGVANTGRRVDVEGTGFTSDVKVTVAGQETEVRVRSAERLETWLPDTGAAGRVAVVVSSPRGGAEVSATGTLVVPEVVAVRPVRRVDSPSSAQVCTSVTGPPVGRTASGAFVNVTASGATAPGYLVVQPDDGSGAPALPGGSTVNLEPGVDTANGTFVPVGPDGRVCVTPVSGARVGRMLVDVTAFAVGTTGVVGVPSTRLLDTRPGGAGDVDGPVRPRTLHTVQVAGRAGVPADAQAVLLNVTTTRVGAPGNLRVFPAGRQEPTLTSTVNYVPGKDKANGTLVQLVDGKVSFWSDSAGAADVLLDVIGYTPAGSTVAAAPEPARVLDTRQGTRTGPLAGPLQPRTGYSLPVTGAGGVPADATAVVLNVTATGAGGLGNLRVYPDTAGDGTSPPPDTSTLNYVAGRDVPNQVVVSLPENGRVALYSDTASGPVHVVADVVGWVRAG